MTAVSRQILANTVTLRNVLQRLNEGVSGLVLIVDESGKLQGIYTDGDARRAVMNAPHLDVPALQHMNTQFTHVPETMAKEDRLKLLNDRVRHLPVLDAEGRPVDMLTWAEMWRLPLVEPSLGGNELKYVSECIRTNWISSQGAFVTRFEKEFAAYHDMPEAVAVSNGTTALHLALEAMRIGPGDEVIVPDLTFGATANAVIHAGAVPVFADVRADDWSLDLESVKSMITPRTRAIIPVHLYGVSARMDELMAFAEAHHLLVLEDCAESLGARSGGKLTGSFGHAAAYSFFANKTITTGEGGMVLTRDAALSDRMRLLRDHGMRKERRYWHEEAGFNYRITNMQSAIGCAQMERLDDFLAHRRALGAAYHEGLGKLDFLEFQQCREGCTNSFWLFSVLVKKGSGFLRDELMQELAKEGIESRPLFYPLHRQPAYSSHPKAQCTVSADLSDRGISLPTSNHMRVDEVVRVCDALAKIGKQGRLPSA